MNLISEPSKSCLCCWLKVGLKILVAINPGIVFPVIIRFLTDFISSMLDSKWQSVVHFAMGIYFTTLRKTLLDCQVAFGIFHYIKNLSLGSFIKEKLGLRSLMWTYLCFLTLKSTTQTFLHGNLSQCTMEILCLSEESWYNFTLCSTFNKHLLRNSSLPGVMLVLGKQKNQGVLGRSLFSDFSFVSLLSPFMQDIISLPQLRIPIQGHQQ